MLLLTSVILGFFTFFATFYAAFMWRSRRLFQLAAKIPGPKGLPLIGMGHKLMTRDCSKIFRFLVSVSDGYNSIMKIWMGPELLIFVDTPESLQIVLNSPKCLDKSALYNNLILTKGLVIAGGNMWKTHRKILNPSFNLSILQQLIPTFDEKSKIFLKNLEKEVGRKEFDVYGYMSACSLETLLKGTMEVDRDIQSGPLDNKYIHDIEV